mmetsp:Transcript_42561/g.109452  ORF Transcript_42561/g.109452 Transcript_42561/m.109452 type:complete len:496 (-) Transcript_42561:630-2117(-)
MSLAMPPPPLPRRSKPVRLFPFLLFPFLLLFWVYLLTGGSVDGSCLVCPASEYISRMTKDHPTWRRNFPLGFGFLLFFLLSLFFPLSHPSVFRKQKSVREDAASCPESPPLHVWKACSDVPSVQQRLAHVLYTGELTHMLFVGPEESSNRIVDALLRDIYALSAAQDLPSDTVLQLTTEDAFHGIQYFTERIENYLASACSGEVITVVIRRVGDSPILQERLRKLMEDRSENVLFLLTSLDMEGCDEAICSRCLCISLPFQAREDLIHRLMVDHGWEEHVCRELVDYCGCNLEKCLSHFFLFRKETFRHHCEKLHLVNQHLIRGQVLLFLRELRAVGVDQLKVLASEASHFPPSPEFFFSHCVADSGLFPSFATPPRQPTSVPCFAEDVAPLLPPPPRGRKRRGEEEGGGAAFHELQQQEERNPSEDNSEPREPLDPSQDPNQRAVAGCLLAAVVEQSRGILLKHLQKGGPYDPIIYLFFLRCWQLATKSPVFQM